MMPLDNDGAMVTIVYAYYSVDVTLVTYVLLLSRPLIHLLKIVPSARSQMIRLASSPTTGVPVPRWRPGTRASDEASPGSQLCSAVGII